LPCWQVKARAVTHSLSLINFGAVSLAGLFAKPLFLPVLVIEVPVFSASAASYTSHKRLNRRG